MEAVTRSEALNRHVRAADSLSPDGGAAEGPDGRSCGLTVRTLSWLVSALMLGSASVCWAQGALPDHPGKQLVATTCTRCHNAEKFTTEKHTRDDWAEEVDVMIRDGTQLTKEQASEIVDYLTASFPGKPKPPGVTVSGPIEADIKEWPVATPVCPPGRSGGGPGRARSGTRDRRTARWVGSTRPPAS